MAAVTPENKLKTWGNQSEKVKITHMSQGEGKGEYDVRREDDREV